MSEQGWRGFLAAEGVEDWVVLHGGATAVFRVGSVREAAQLAEAVAAVPGLEGSGTLLTIADARLTVRLSRDLWQLEPQHVELDASVVCVDVGCRHGSDRGLTRAVPSDQHGARRCGVPQHVSGARQPSSRLAVGHLPAVEERVQARREVLGAAATLGVLRKPSRHERRHVACRDDSEAVAARTSGAGAPLPP